MDIEKKALVAALIEHLENELVAMKAAARATHEAATHEESKPENEYDTRGLEASYLAGAQAKRAGEIDETLSLFRRTEFRPFNPTEPIAATALVEIQGPGGRRQWLLMMPMGGGTKLTFAGHEIQVVTPVSTLGEALIGLKAGEIAEVEVGDKITEFRILSVR